MNLEGFNCQGMWFIPLIICFIIFILFSHKKGFAPFSFLSKENSGNRESEESSLETLNKRYARGEITKSEYEDIKRDIEY